MAGNRMNEVPQSEWKANMWTGSQKSVNLINSKRKQDGSLIRQRRLVLSCSQVIRKAVESD